MRSDAAVTLAAQVVKALVNFASLVILARILSVEDFGTAAIMAAVLAFGMMFGDFGLSLAALQKREASHAQRSNLFWLNAAIGSVLWALVVGVGPILAAFYSQPELSRLGVLVGATVFIHLVGAQFRVELGRCLRFRLLAVADGTSAVVGLAGGVIVALGGGGVWALISQQFVAAVWLVLIMVIRSGWRPSWPRRDVSVAEFFNFGFFTFLSQMVTYVSTHVDSLVIGRVLGSGALGHYDRGFQIARMPLLQFLSPLTRVVLPYMTRSTDSEREIPHVVSEIHRVVAFSAALGYGLFAALSAPLVDVILGSGWEPVGPIVALLCPGLAIQAAGYVLYWGMLARGRARLILVSELPGRVLLIVGVMVAVRFGVMWVPVAVSVGYVAIWIGQLRSFSRLTGANPAVYVRVLVLGLISASVGYVAVRLVAMLGLSVLAEVALSLVVYSAGSIAALVLSRSGRAYLGGTYGIMRAAVLRIRR